MTRDGDVDIVTRVTVKDCPGNNVSIALDAHSREGGIDDPVNSTPDKLRNAFIRHNPM